MLNNHTLSCVSSGTDFGSTQLDDGYDDSLEVLEKSNSPWQILYSNRVRPEALADLKERRAS